MLAFDDDFQRADGPLGNPWFVEFGVMSLLSGTLRTTSTGRAKPNVDPTGPNSCQRAWVNEPTSFSRTIEFRFRQDLAMSTYVAVRYVFNATTIAITITTYTAGVGTQIAGRTIGNTYGGQIDLMCSCIGSNVLAWVGSYLYLATFQTAVMSYGTNALALLTTDLFIDRYAYYDLTSTSVEPDIVEVPGSPGDYVVTLHNTGADWVPGTPGAPVFTATQGTITAQTVDDTDTATVQWTAPTLLTPGFLYDPQNEYFYTFDINTTGFPNGGGGGGGGLTPTQAATLAALKLLLDALAAQTPSETEFVLNLWGAVLQMHMGPGQSDGSAIGDTMAAILDATTGIGAIAQYAHSIWDRLDWATDQGNISLNTVQNNVRGQNLPSIATAIDEVQTGIRTTEQYGESIESELAAIRTANQWTLEHVRQWIEAIEGGSNADVLQELALIRTANNWTLGHIMDAIAALPHSDYSGTLQTILNTLLQIPTNPVTSLQPVLDAIAFHNQNLNGKAADILAAIALIPTNPITSLQPVLDSITGNASSLNSHIQALEDKIDALAPATAANVPPVWPGLANVTLGNPVQITESFSVDQPCDGIIISITSAPTKQGYYTYHTARSYRNIGSVSFYDDEGHQEYAITLGFTSAVYCPKTMRHAAGCRIRTAAQVLGTVTPWSITTN